MAKTKKDKEEELGIEKNIEATVKRINKLIKKSSKNNKIKKIRYTRDL